MVRRVVVSGVVQGVGFRPCVYRVATSLGLRGTVRNMGDAGVEIVTDCDAAALDAFLGGLRAGLPPNARIDAVRVEETAGADGAGSFDGFTIAESGGRGSRGVIPPDTAVCDDCLAEMFGGGDPRRRFYPFTSCIACGSRFSTIGEMPYDRARTSLAAFPPCPDCAREYASPGDRRFHYQGNACAACGPRYTLLDAGGRTAAAGPAGEVVAAAVRALDGGRVVAIKGVSGTHLACSAVDDEAVRRLRGTFGRDRKPFAVMAAGVASARAIARVSPGEESLLASRARPIVLLDRAPGSRVSREVAPGLHNVGVMLPYSGVHHCIFRSGREEPLVMTSANFSGEPMLIDNDAILARLRGTADFFLVHDLVIRNRCDDSLARRVDGGPLFIRRSRGFAPSDVKLPFECGKTILCTGSELNNTVCLVRGSDAYVSQYVGDTTHEETLGWVARAAGALLEMTGTAWEDVEAVAVDLNPVFDVRRWAEELAAARGVPLLPVQHHVAHAASLVADCGRADLVAIAVDGTGYGEDGRAWGGEVIALGGGAAERTGHLQYQRMPGGDAAAYFPARMLAGIMYGSRGEGIVEALRPLAGALRHGERELAAIAAQCRGGLNVAWTSSCGRVLDALAAMLGACGERTYEGEPAMRLESLARGGDAGLDVPVVVEGGVLDTTRIVERAWELARAGEDPARIAASCQAAIARGLAGMAVGEAARRGARVVGLTGGVACNAAIHETVGALVRAAGLDFVTNRSVPCGDGGVSLGQGIYLALSMGWAAPLRG